MSQKTGDVVVVGLLCLDVIPGFLGGQASLADLVVPGKLVEVGDATISTGGATSNTGLALHRLGFDTRIAGKVGDDAFGRAIVDILRSHGDHLAEHIIVAPGEGSSYTIVISPPGIDRIFFHSPGTCNTFMAREVPDSALDGARLLHFGYPPLVQSFAVHNGRELKELYARGRERGMTCSLDMARPDPDGPSGRIDWADYLVNVLPEVDVFLPSLDEIIYMVDPALFEKLLREAGPDNPAGYPDIDTIRDFADRMLAMGPAVVGFKLGDQGFYLRTTSDKDRLARMGALSPKDPEVWRDIERITPCRMVKVAGTLGAGDCTVAGFLGALLQGMGPDEATAMAVATGAAGVEAMDAHSGVPRWETLLGRIEAGWPQAESSLIPATWVKTPAGNRCRP